MASSTKSNEIEAWNNAAVSCLQNGDTVMAVKIFKLALTAAYEELAPKAIATPANKACDHIETLAVIELISRGDSSEPCTSRSSTNALHTGPIRTVDVMLAAQHSGIFDKHTEKDIFEVYTKVFDASALLSAQGQIVAILFNMALSFDLRSLLFTESTTQKAMSAANAWRDQAMILYRSAIDVARTTWSCTELASMRCLLLALTNNLGRLSALQMCFDGTRDCLVLSRALLATGEAASQIPREDFELLYRSLGPFLYLRGHNVLPVSPAA